MSKTIVLAKSKLELFKMFLMKEFGISLAHFLKKNDLECITIFKRDGKIMVDEYGTTYNLYELKGQGRKLISLDFLVDYTGYDKDPRFFEKLSYENLAMSKMKPQFEITEAMVFKNLSSIDLKSTSVITGFEFQKTFGFQ